MKVYKYLLMGAFIVLIVPLWGMKKIKFKNIKGSHFLKNKNMPSVDKSTLFKNYSTNIIPENRSPNVRMSSAQAPGKNYYNKNLWPLKNQMQNKISRGNWRFGSENGTGYFSGRLYSTSTNEKIEKRMQQDQDKNYRETIIIANDVNNETLRTLRKKVQMLISEHYGSLENENPQGKKKGIYGYMKRLDSDKSIFSSVINTQKNKKTNPEKNKIRILTARLYLLDQQLQEGVDTINLSGMENNPFYQYTKTIFLPHIPKERFSRDIETLILPQSIDDCINTLRDMTWSANYRAYVIPDKNNLAQDLCANVLLKYVLFEPKCTTEQFMKFYAFLDKMKMDKEYRQQQLKKLELVSLNKNAEKTINTNNPPQTKSGLWLNFLSGWGKFFKTPSQGEDTNE